MQAKFLRSYASPADVPTEGLFQVAFIGRSNAGKSSLINSLTKTPKLARTSSEPGYTKLINLFDVGHIFHLVDLPGYGFARGSRQQRENLFDLIDGYLETAKLLRLAIVIIDSRIGTTNTDEQMLEYLQENGIPYFLIANKADKLSNNELASMIAALKKKYPEATIFPHSALTGLGREELYRAIIARIALHTGT